MGVDDVAARWADVRRDMRTIAHVLRPARRDGTLMDRLERFYGRQAHDYDRFRNRMLAGCGELVTSVASRSTGVWVDLGGGTGRNLAHLDGALSAFSRIYVVDLSPSLLAVARARCEREGWDNVTVLHADAATVDLAPGSADIVTFAYSLTMMPEWILAIERARTLLKPGGLIGVVDYYVSNPRARPPRHRHHAVTRTFWKLWFGRCGVHLNPDHLTYLTHCFAPVVVKEARAGLPYFPGARVPYYTFIGRRRAPAGTPSAP